MVVTGAIFSRRLLTGILRAAWRLKAESQDFSEGWMTSLMYRHREERRIFHTEPGPWSIDWFLETAKRQFCTG